MKAFDSSHLPKTFLRPRPTVGAVAAVGMAGVCNLAKTGRLPMAAHNAEAVVIAVVVIGTGIEAETEIAMVVTTVVAAVRTDKPHRALPCRIALPANHWRNCGGALHRPSM